MIETFLLLIVLSIAQDTDLASETPTAESVIDHYVSAKGGKQQLLRITNDSIAGKIELIGEDGREAFGNFLTYQTDGRSESHITFPDGTVISHGTDGKIAWSISEHSNPSILKGQESRDYIRHHNTLHKPLAWQEMFQEIRYAGQDCGRSRLRLAVKLSFHRLKENDRIGEGRLAKLFFPIPILLTSLQGP